MYLKNLQTHTDDTFKLQAIKTLGLFKKLSIFDKAPGASLPEAYKKFYKEWQFAEPTAVHYIPEEGRWKRNEVTGEVYVLHNSPQFILIKQFNFDCRLPIQNAPIPLKYPKEHNYQLWGGEGVIQGFQKRDKYSRRVPHFWVPSFKRSVVYSEVLDKYISVIVTDRALTLIHSNYGFDHYLLKVLNKQFILHTILILLPCVDSCL